MDTTPAAFISARDLWKGYDPEALPLEVESLQSWEEEGCTYEKLRFTGEIAEGVKIRVFAIQGAPTGGKKRPGLLHIHGGGQTASLAWVKFWAKRGYVCVTFDFCGLWEKRTEVTDWGPLKQANMATANGGLQIRPTPRESSWYHWTVAARRALTLLAKHPTVDPERLGIFGISVGGNLTWMVAGSDRRVKVAVPIYGSGYNYEDRKTRWGFAPLSDDLALFKRTLSPEAHAPLVRCPVLHLDATNDFHAWMDYSYEILEAARGPVRQSFTPRYNHHIAPEQASNLERWMDWHLRDGKPFPATPRLTIALNAENIPRAQVAVKEGREVQQVEIYYALGDKIPPARYWRSAPVPQNAGRWEAVLPIMDAGDSLTVFANVRYRSGVCLSSNLTHAIPARIGPAKATLLWSPTLEHGRDGLENWVYTAAYTDPNISASYLRTQADGQYGPCLTLNTDLFGNPMTFNISTHLLGDPQFQGRERSALAFRVKGGFTEEGLTVSVIENDWGPRSKTYSARIEKTALDSGWQEIVLPPSRFVSADGKTLTDWKGVDRLEIRGAASKQEPPCFARFRWKEL
jgi:dienelactone hydrolase